MAHIQRAAEGRKVAMAACRRCIDNKSSDDSEDRVSQSEMSEPLQKNEERAVMHCFAFSLPFYGSSNLVVPVVGIPRWKLLQVIQLGS
jgi:hypothetical protein